MSKNTSKKSRKARKSSVKVHFKKTGKNMTSKAGLIPVIKFLDKLKFNQLFQTTINHERKDNAFYSFVDCVFIMMTGAIGGAFSISKCSLLWSNCSVLKKVAGWLRIPDETTVGRIFKEVNERHVSEMESLVHTIRKKVWNRSLCAGTSKIAALPTLWVDVDSTVKTVYGNQEGAAKGYNTHKKGALSYHPLLAFCTHTKEILQGWFRAGDSYTSNGVVEFMKQLLDQLTTSKRIVFRGDSGFFVGALMDYLDALGHGYLIKVKLKNLAAVMSRQKWESIHDMTGWEQCQFWYCAKGWKTSRLLVAVRQKKPIEYSAQKELLPLEKYDYFCYASTENFTPFETHKNYGQRATSETWIEEAKTQLGLAHVKTDNFLANATLFQCAILAYNTLRWMALTSGNTQLKIWEPESVRVHLICIAGKLLTAGNQVRIILPEKHLYSGPWDDWLMLAA